MDEHPDPEWFDEVEQIALSHPEVQSIEKVRLRKLGFNIIMYFHLREPPNLSVEEGYRLYHELKRYVA